MPPGNPLMPSTGQTLQPTQSFARLVASQGISIGAGSGFVISTDGKEPYILMPEQRWVFVPGSGTCAHGRVYWVWKLDATSRTTQADPGVKTYTVINTASMPYGWEVKHTFTDPRRCGPRSGVQDLFRFVRRVMRLQTAQETGMPLP